MKKDKPHFKYLKEHKCWVVYDHKYFGGFHQRNKGSVVTFGYSLEECKDKYIRLVAGMCA